MSFKVKFKRLEKFILKYREAGQTLVEYSLLLMVVASLCFAIMKKFRFAIFGDGECPNSSYFCEVVDSLSGGPLGIEARYRFYTLKQ